MPRYFFHVHDDFDALDDEGLDLPSAQAAHDVAVEGARDLACAEVKAGRIILGHCVELADESGAVIDVVTFRDAVRVEG